MKIENYYMNHLFSIKITHYYSYLVKRYLKKYWKMSKYKVVEDLEVQLWI
jgi:hypothetical protein